MKFFDWLFGRKSKLLDYKLLEIKIPLEEEKNGERDLNKEMATSEQLFNSLLSIGSPFVFEASVHDVGEDIHFYVSVPSDKTDFVSRQVQGLFLKSQVTEVPDYTIFSSDGSAAACYLSLRDSYILPLRTYAEAGVDTFSQVLSNLSKLSEVGEGASVQIVVAEPATGAKKSVVHSIEALKKGEKLSKILKTSLISTDDLKKLFGSNKKNENKQIIVDDEAIKSLSAKISKPLFAVNIRIVAAGAEKGRAQDILRSIAGAYGGTTAPLRNEIKVVSPSKIKKLLYQYSFREFDPASAITLNSEELVSLFHLPTISSAVPRVSLLRSKDSVPPENLPTEGVVIGESNFRGDKKLVRLIPDDRRRHLYIIGQTGTGKSYAMLNMAVQDISDGNGVCVIDPHGETINDILERVPAHRAGDVIIFDPGDLSRPVGLNMLEYDPTKPEQKTFIVNEIQAIFNRLFAKETMWPMFEQYMRNTLLLLMGDVGPPAGGEPATLMEVPRVMIDPIFRARKLERCKDPAVVDFWTKEASKTSGETSLANMAPYITTKFGNFTTNEYIRPIIGQTKSAFNFRKIMDDKKILLVNLSKGKIGDINAGLLGMIITTRILMAALSREDSSKESRPDFYFYIDEFQNFTTDSISTILSEARKYRLNLILAHQFIAQLEDKIRESVFGNVGSLMAFRVGEPDTEKLEKQFSPEFSAKDLISIKNRNAIAKILINGEPSRPFNLYTQDAGKGSPELREKLKELSRLTFGRPRAEIETEILARLRN